MELVVVLALVGAISGLLLFLLETVPDQTPRRGLDSFDVPPPRPSVGDPPDFDG